MNKIVELLIDWENLEFDDLGVEVMSLVDKPAIGVDFLAFADEHEFVEPKSGESEDEFISRCIPVVKGEGYEDDQAAAICYTYWEGSEDAKAMEAYLQLARELGETIDYENAVYIDGTKTQFNTISDYLKGIIGLDILGKKINKDEVGEIRYRYAGPTAERPFCQAMLRANKVYTYEELQTMGRSTINGIDSGPNALMRWKGGPNCRHFFERVRLYKDGNRTVIVSEGPATENEMNVTMESRPNGGYRMSFSSDEEMIVSGPAMIPQQLILRKDEKDNPFHVYFSKETIKNIARKFFEYNKMNNTDIDHDEKVTTENTLLESWIVEDPEMDKSKSLGYSVPKGTWMVSYKINNQETWQKIKEGKINGFSIAGNFIEVAKKL